MEISVPGVGTYTLTTIVLDLNGTLSVRGKLVPGVAVRLKKLQSRGFRIVLFSGDTRGTAATYAERLGIELVVTASATDKARELKKYGAKTTVAIGNGQIDVPLLRSARLSIVTLQAEGVHTQALLAADIVVTSIVDAFDILLDTPTLISTLRR